MVQIGEDPIQSFEDPGADTCELTYDRLVEFLISINSWSFSERTVQLSRDSETPKGWDYQFTLPAERVGPPTTLYDSLEAIEQQRPYRVFELSEDKLLSGAEELWATIKVLPPPLHWPGYFRELVTRGLEAYFMLSIREDNVQHRAMMQEVFGTPSQMMQGGLVGVTKGLDASAKPSSRIPIDGGPLVRARFGD